MVANFTGLRDTLTAAYGAKGVERGLDVPEVGCNAGAHSMVWAEPGHRVCGIDINEPLLTIARERAADANLTVGYRLGSATDVPWPDASFDVCAAPELLEPWKAGRLSWMNSQGSCGFAACCISAPRIRNVPCTRNSTPFTVGLHLA
ncbi:MAG: class I SAM-dependent methyltransferase [Rhodospirillales bacterium]|nr:MAG: class I SAM-dependent methyltransferase [Rhodospirillales bacterium]